MSKSRNDLLKASSNRQQSILALWRNLSEDEQGTISGGIAPILPINVIEVHLIKFSSPGELDRIK